MFTPPMSNISWHHRLFIEYFMPPMFTPSGTESVEVLQNEETVPLGDLPLDGINHYSYVMSIMLPPGAVGPLAVFSVPPWSIITVPPQDLTSPKSSVILYPGGDLIAPAPGDVFSIPLGDLSSPFSWIGPLFVKTLKPGVMFPCGCTQYHHDCHFTVPRPGQMPPRVYFFPPGSTIMTPRASKYGSDASSVIREPGGLLVAHGDIASGFPPE